MKRRARLTAVFVKNVRPKARVTYYPDAHCLRLRVKPSGAKSWTQRLTILGKRRDLGLGEYPLVSLGEARDAAFNNRRIARQGADPTKADATFRQIAAAKMNLDAPSLSPRTDKGNRDMLKRYAYPALGALKVSAVQPFHVIGVIAPLWAAKYPTAKRVLSLISRTFAYSTAMGYTESNPARLRTIKAALPALPKAKANGNGTKHHESVSHASVRDALAKIDASKAMPSSKALVRFATLTVARISEARLARWSEIDVLERVWTIPAERMKARREHQVPLSDQAVTLLHGIAKRRPLVFHGYTGKPLGESTVRKLMRSQGVGGTIHGMRASFRTWAAETRIDRDVAERCLAHVAGNAVEQAYNRSDLLELRRKAMQAWADYVEGA